MRASAIVTFALIGLAACSNSSSIPGNAQSASHSAAARAAAGRGLSDLDIADYGVGSIVLLKNSDYSRQSKITAGINGSNDVALDGSGNLFVANASGVNVTEYAPGTKSPSFTYSAGMVEPLFVTIGVNGNLYEVDSGNSGGVGNNDGFINEYRPKGHALVNSCQTGTHPMGIAVDSKGHIFVAVNSKSTRGRIIEYTAGLKGCAPTMLGVRLGFAAGIALDANANLIAADYDRTEVDVIAPPYTNVTKRLAANGKLNQPYWVSINGANTKVFVTDFFNGAVLVLDYETGNLVHWLGYFDSGVTVAAGTADGP